MKRLIKIILVAALVGCGNPEPATEQKATETCIGYKSCAISKERLEPEKRLLAEHGIPYTESKNEGELTDCYSISREYCERAKAIFESARGKMPPSCYSIGLENDLSIIAEVEKEFSDMEVPTHRMNYDGKVYLVWAPEYQKKVIELGYAFEDSLDPANCEG